MNLPNVYDYTGQHSVTFQNGSVSKNTWNDWGLIPSSRHSEPINEVWSQAVTIPGINGQEDLVRMSPYTSVNSYSKLRSAIANDNRDYILSTYGFDIFQPSSGSLSFIIADQEQSFFSKQQEILNFLHNRVCSMKFSDDPSKIYKVRTTISSFSNSNTFSNVSINYSVLSEN